MYLWLAGDDCKSFQPVQVGLEKQWAAPDKRVMKVVVAESDALAEVTNDYECDK